MLKLTIMIKILVFTILASMWMGCDMPLHKEGSNKTSCPIHDTLHTLFMERFNRFSDSMNENNNKALMAAASRHPDSAMYYLGKSSAYLEMETKELHK